MKTNFKFLVTALLLLVSYAMPQAQTGGVYQIDTELSIVTLRMGHSLLGRFDTVARNSLTGSINIDGKGKVSAQVIEFRPDRLSSLISLRDSHMKDDYLDVKNYPYIYLRNSIAQLFDKTKSPNEGENIKGVLEVKGKSVPIEGKGKLYLEEDTLKGRLEFNTQVSLYPIKTPNYMGVGVKDDFTVLVEIVARPDLSDIEKSISF